MGFSCMKDFGLPNLKIEMDFPQFKSGEQTTDSNGVGEKSSPLQFIHPRDSARLFNPNLPIDRKNSLITINTTT